MKYILLSDYDGTLRQNGEIDKSVLVAIKEFRDKGNLFAVVSGRGYETGYKKFKENNEFPFDYVINNNGAYACDYEGNVVFSKTVDAKMSFGKSTFLKHFVKRGMELTNNKCVVDFERERWAFHPDSLSGDEIFKPISDIDKILKFSSVHLLCNNDDNAAGVCDVLKQEFGDYINPVQNGFAIDVTPLGVDKASGIQYLIDAVGIDKDFVWTVGDNYNDYTMIEKYHGCAIKSGVEKLKDVAEYVCDDVGDAINIISNNEKSQYA